MCRFVPQIKILFLDMGLLNIEALTSQLNLNAGFGHPNDLAGTSGGNRHDQNGPGNGFGGHGGHGGLLSNHHLHNGMGLGLKSAENQSLRQQSFLLGM